MTHSRPRLLIAILLTVASFAAACTGADAVESTDDAEVDDAAGTDAETDGSATDDTDAAATDDDTGSDDTDDAAAPEKTPEEQALDFSACMRDQGVPDFPDIEVGPSGEVGIGDITAVVDIRDPEVQTALAACQGVLAGGGLGAQLQEALQSQDVADALVQFSDCVGAEGFDVPDLTLNAILAAAIAPSDDAGTGSDTDQLVAILAEALQLDPTDPAVSAAVNTCLPIIEEAARELGLG